MLKRVLGLMIAGIILWSVTTSAFNLFATAGAIGEQQVAMTFGFGLTTTDLGGGGSWYLVPQGRVTIGLLDGLDLGVQSGWTTEIGTGSAQWLGTLFDVKLTAVEVPGNYTLAWGAGGGYGLDFFGNGWGVFLQLLFESHSKYFPVFITYRSALPFDTLTPSSIEFDGYIAGGLCLRLAPIARLLLVVDVHGGLASLGMGLEVAF